jgi:hypothetical protein
MRSAGLLLLGLAACAHPPPREPAAPPAPGPPLPAVEMPPPSISLGELGADGMSAEWLELQMPSDAQVLTFSHDVPEGRETWTLVSASDRRVLRVRLENGTKVAQAAWAGTKTKEAMDLRLVEVRGNVRMPAPTLRGTCRRDGVCEEGNPRHRVTVEMCTFEDATTGSAEVTFLAPGKGVDFAVGSCRSAARRGF